MSRSRKSISKEGSNGFSPERAKEHAQIRKMNRLKDDVYREMLLLEVNRPGAEMGLALALLRAVVQSQTFVEQEEFRDWLKTTCPLGLHMIEAALGEGLKCDLRAER